MFCKKEKEIKKLSLQFLNICTDGEKGQELTRLFENAELLDEKDQLFDAVDMYGDNCFHKVCQYGLKDVLVKIIEFYDKNGRKIDHQAENKYGFTPLMLVCCRGYKGVEAVNATLPTTKINRKEIAKILIEKGADVNFEHKVNQMTPLHWAAYNDDKDVVELLLYKGANQKFNRSQVAPVDIAGFCGNSNIVEAFGAYFEQSAAAVYKLQRMGSLSITGHQLIPDNHVEDVMNVRAGTILKKDVQMINLAETSNQNGDASPFFNKQDKPIVKSTTVVPMKSEEERTLSDQVVNKKGVYNKLNALFTNTEVHFSVAKTKEEYVAFHKYLLMSGEEADNGGLKNDIEDPEIQRSKFTHKQVIELRRSREVPEVGKEHEDFWIRTVYWCANMGIFSPLELYIEKLKFSPFIRSYSKRSILSGAIRGSQLEMVRYILKFQYLVRDADDYELMRDNMYKRDNRGNTPLHYSYDFDQPEVRSLLKENGLYFKNARNWRGLVPSQMLHDYFFDDSVSDSELDEDDDQFMDIKSYRQYKLNQGIQDMADQVETTVENLFSNTDNQILQPERNETQNNDETQQEKPESKDEKDCLRIDGEKRYLKIDKFTTELTDEDMVIDKTPLEFRRLWKRPSYCMLVPKSSKDIIKLELKSLIQNGGCFYEIFPKYNEPDKVYFVIFFEQPLIDLLAEMQNTVARLSGYECLIDFKAYAGDHFTQFNGRQKQTIILKALRKQFDIDHLKYNNVVLDEFLCHDDSKKRVRASWNDFKWRLSLSFAFLGNWKKYAQPLDFIAHYYGEKQGFYFAWLVHYTSWLIVPGIIGIIVTIVQVVNFYRADPAISFDDAIDSPLNTVYSLFIVIWAAFFNESWKQKQTIIANQWQVSNFDKIQTERKGFRATLDVDAQTQSIWKRVYENPYTKTLGEGVPVSLAFIALLIVTQYGIYSLFQYLAYDSEDVQRDHTTLLGWFIFKFITNTPFLLQAVLIIAYGKIYQIVATKLVTRENHRTNEAYENSMIVKTYFFGFFNSYTSFCMYAFWARSFYKVAQQLANFMILKQIALNLFEWGKLRFNIRKRIKKVDAYYEVAIKMAQDQNDLIFRDKLQMMNSIEKQQAMVPADDNLINYYKEGITQLGYMVLFANVLPISPAFCVVCNLIEVQIKLDMMATTQRRGVCEGASNIGIWIHVMDLLAIIAIPMNVAIIYFTGDSNWVKRDGTSSAVKWLKANSTYFKSDMAIVALLVIIEHCLLLIKMVIQVSIRDKPQNIIEADYKRQYVRENAEQQMQTIKEQQGGQTYDEVLAKHKQDVEAIVEKTGPGLGSLEKLSKKMALKMKKTEAEKDAIPTLLKGLMDSRDKKIQARLAAEKERKEHMKGMSDIRGNFRSLIESVKESNRTPPPETVISPDDLDSAQKED